MSDNKEITKYIRFDENVYLAVEEYRRNSTPIPSFAEAARKLITRGLESEGYAPPK